MPCVTLYDGKYWINLLSTPQQTNEGTNQAVVKTRLAGLNNRFLSEKDEQEQAKILTLSDETAAELGAWSGRFPFMRQVRITPLALSVAASAPFCSVRTLVSTAKMSLWVFALDDLFDEAGESREHLLSMSQQYKAISQGLDIKEPVSELAFPLVEIREDLASYRLFKNLKATWSDSLSGTIGGMIQEYDWREQYRRSGKGALPSYEKYLNCGRYSIGGPPHVWSSLITIGDLTTPMHLKHLLEMDRLASECIRLANDLQTADKERLEQNVNSLVILEHKGILAGRLQLEAHQWAKKRINTDISERLNTLASMKDTARTESGRPEAALDNIARFVCEFYAEHDFHTYFPPPNTEK